MNPFTQPNSFSYFQIRREHLRPDDTCTIDETKLVEIISQIPQNPQNITILGKYFNEHDIGTSLPIIHSLVESLIASNDLSFEIHVDLYQLFHIIDKKEIGLILFNEGLHTRLVSLFPSFASMILYRQMVRSSEEAANFLLTHTQFLTLFQDPKIYSETNQYLVLYLDLLSAFDDYFDLYNDIFPIISVFIQCIFQTSSHVLLYYFLMTLSRFGYSYQISNEFVSHPSFHIFLYNIKESQNGRLLTDLFYLIQIMFSTSPYNIIIENGERIHSSAKLMQTTSIIVKNEIIITCLAYLNPESPDLIIEYALKALNPFFLKETIEIMKEHQVYEKLVQILSDEPQFSTKGIAFQCLINLFTSADPDFSKQMIFMKEAEKRNFLKKKLSIIISRVYNFFVFIHLRIY